MSRVYGAVHNLERAVGTHLFGICPNNSGSTFLKEALATCRATWNLKHEGQHMLGFVGPSARQKGRLIWSTERRWFETLTDPRAYDWPRTREAWYFQAFARDAQASVFFTKTPPFLLYVDELARHFSNPKFLFMVRNPYAVCEGICRNLQGSSLARGRDLPVAAARHVATCLDYQRRNIETHGDRGVFFTYEAMCDDPERVEDEIRSLVPELDDLVLRQRLRVKGHYDEMLTNMNERQIARLSAKEIAAFNRVFSKRRKLLEHFGYSLMEPRARNPAAQRGEVRTAGRSRRVLERPGRVSGTGPGKLRRVGKPAVVRHLGAVDVSVLRRHVDRLSEKVWRQEDAAKENDYPCFHHTRHIVFRFIAGNREPLRFYSNTIWSVWRRILMPVMASAAAPYGFADPVYPKVMLARLEAGRGIDPHMDGGGSSPLVHKIHVPLRSDRKAVMHVDGQEFHLETGHAYEVNNLVPHGAFNGGEGDRTHLIFEVFDAAGTTP